MSSKIILKRTLNIFSWLFICVSVILLIFGFGEDGIRILKVAEFWAVINSLWILAILLFTIENRIK